VRREGVGTAQVLTLPRAGKSWRLLLVAALTVLVVAGTLVGNDPWWPFGPWRMFATSTKPSTAVVVMAIEIRTADDPTWRPAPLTPWQVGLNRAEVEGRIPQIEAQPARLGTLAASHHDLHPDAPAWTGVRLVRRDTVLAGRAPTGEVRSQVLAQWSAP
jgi:hypothetical protein